MCVCAEYNICALDVIVYKQQRNCLCSYMLSLIFLVLFGILLWILNKKKSISKVLTNLSNQFSCKYFRICHLDLVKGSMKHFCMFRF